ncbi:MAG: zinc ribbon domain-containing protein [Peptostreptococcaceae bacterium]
MSDENKVNEEVNESVRNMFCSKCGLEIQEGQKFCPTCGNKVNSINLSRIKIKINKKIIGVIGIVIILLVASVAMNFKSKEKQKQEARIQYLISVNEFKQKAISAGTNIEDIADTVQNYWNEYIFEKKHGYSIDSAVGAALDDKSIAVDSAKKYDEEILTLYHNLKTIPEGSEDLKNILNEVDDLYKSYSAFYDLAMEPSGNYTQYTNNNNNKTDEFIANYKALDNTIKTNPEFIQIEEMINTLRKNMNSIMKEYDAITESLPKELESDDDYKKLIPVFKEKKNIDIDKVKKESEKLKENTEVKKAIESISSTSEAYIKAIEHSKKYNKSKSKEDLKEFKSAVLDFRAHVTRYIIQIDSLDDDGESLKDKISRE